MATEKLSALKVVRVMRRGMYNDGGNLYLRVAPSGSKQWVFRYKLNGKQHDMGLGGLDTFTLKEARERARELRKQKYAGTDPIAARRAAQMQARLERAKAVTFEECAEAYIEAHQDGWKNSKHREQWRATLQTYAYPMLGRLSVQAIDTGLVTKVIEPIWKTKTETASRVRGRIEAVLDWAAARGFRQGENPARWRGHLENLLPRKSKVAPVEHHAALPYNELPAFIAELRAQKGISARALEFAILTAARTNEALGATWDEIDLAEKVWIIPPERIKAGRPHRIALSTAAFDIVSQMRQVQSGRFVFPGAKSDQPLSNMALLMLLRRLRHEDLTVHGFRSSFADWAAERTAYPDEVRQMALAHSVSDKVEAAYRRGDLFEKRRALGQAWADFCRGPGALPTSSVVPIRG